MLLLPNTTIATLFLFALFAADPALCGQSPSGAQGTAPRVIHVRAEMFRFSPSQITVKKGETVELSITTKDVKHGLRIRQLGIDIHVEPGQTTNVLITPLELGHLTADCSVFCGTGHKQMQLTINVKP
jgi:cytochrome c oxidase subunit II